MKRIAFGPFEFHCNDGSPRFYVRLWRRVFMWWPKEKWSKRLEITTASLILALCLFLVGCQVQSTPTTQPVAITPAQVLSASTQTLAAALNTASTARDLGIITQADMNAAKSAVDAAYSARNTAERDLRAGNVSNLQSDLNQVQSALVQLEPLLAKAGKK